jgi:poly-gamma-glutamate capsule biosynthesis protein CapA/YwtB (metallophosphatase superfamily)
MKGADMAQQDVITLVGVGDISPNRDDPPSIFRHCGDVFRTADIVFGQMESTLSDRGSPQFVPHAPSKLAARNVSALTKQGAGFDVMSFASNHAVDYGYEAFHDTLDALKNNNIAIAGAGRNIEEARKPVILERNGTRVGFLAYLSIVFPGLVAEEDRPGCVPLRASHYYKQMDFQPGTPPLIVTQLVPEDKKAMEEDIRKLRPQVDVLVVSIHAGVHFVPATVAMYQKEAAYHAIDTGADLVLQHHAHILKGVEMYNGKAIFYGLGNFALEHSKISIKKKAGDPSHRGMRGFYKVKPIPGWENYHYLPDARMTMIAKAYIQDKKISKVSYIPAYVNPQSEPEVVTRRDPRAQEVFDYVAKISEDQELKVGFAWEGDEVLLRTGEEHSARAA